MAICSKSYFSDATILTIKANPDTEFLSQPCAACGLRVVAKNYGGNWMPKTHHKPKASPVYRSGKSNGKR